MSETDKLPPLLAATACLTQALDKVAPAHRGEMFAMLAGLAFAGMAQERGAEAAAAIAYLCGDTLSGGARPAMTSH